MKWRVVDTGTSPAAEVMAYDAKLLEELAENPFPILHLYEWKHPSATYGHFSQPEKLLSDEAQDLIDLARRPTGGGVIFHVADWAFSILIPASHPNCFQNTLENYAYVNALVMEGIKRLLGKETNATLLPREPVASCEEAGCFCMGKPTKYDVVIDGRKAAGGAQRRTRHGYLHQGTLSLALPEDDLLDRILKKGSKVKEEMIRNTYPLIGQCASAADIAKARAALRQHFIALVNDI
jgi:lipoate-protein ligase A